MSTNDIENKHRRYYESYLPNDIFWGIGIENETYLQFDKKKEVSYEFIKSNHKRERYSVDYFLSYKENVFKNAINNLVETKNIDVNLPILMNSHSFDKTDMTNQSKTTYEKIPKFNPKYSGMTLMELIFIADPYFEKEFGKSYVFDGDTIEFMTQNFYKATIEDTINELIEIKTKFITKLQEVFKKLHIFQEHGTIQFADKNHGIALLMTNLNNINIFNNMTYHFNFTLPTKLNENSEIENMEEFKKAHQKCIRILQYMSPLLLAVYGTPDFLSKSNISYLFSKTSQRCAVSRYIGIGTYDTDKMETGKILVQPYDQINATKNKFYWYNLHRTISGYSKLGSVGMDFNYNKYKNHGIEFRIFEYFPEKELYELLNFFIYLFDHTATMENIDNPIYDETWNKMMYKIMINGNINLSEDEINMYEKIFRLKIESRQISIIVSELIEKIRAKYLLNGCYSKYMIKK